MKLKMGTLWAQRLWKELKFEKRKWKQKLLNSFNEKNSNFGISYYYITHQKGDWHPFYYAATNYLLQFLFQRSISGTPLHEALSN